MSETVERFSADWLALREPVDGRARSRELADALADWSAARVGGSRPARPLHVVDLGSGTGSNLRWLAPVLAGRLPGSQAWTLVDHDAALLKRALGSGGPRPADVRVAGVHASHADAEGRLAPEVDQVIAGADVVTASALLDLVSEPVLSALVGATVRAGAAALFALSYDGAIEWTPADPGDALVRDALNAHQRRDKGTGPALGPAAGSAAADAFTDAGYRCTTASTPWTLGPADAPLVRMLVDGWLSAAVEQRPADTEALSAWAARRDDALDSGFALRVGHLDVLALPS